MMLCMIYDIYFGECISPTLIIYKWDDNVRVADVFIERFGVIPTDWKLEALEV